uniref:Cyclin N-terminal domain-containing protein n=1 Tax=Plectus sambesii TaxID=2011161 RepID=A0A914VVS6_9BILA
MRKQMGRRYHLLVAQNFLGNISLDGTHQDTTLRIFDVPGLPVQFSHSASCEVRTTNKQVTFDESVEDFDEVKLLAAPPSPIIEIDIESDDESNSFKFSASWSKQVGQISNEKAKDRRWSASSASRPHGISDKKAAVLKRLSRNQSSEVATEFTRDQQQQQDNISTAPSQDSLGSRPVTPTITGQITFFQRLRTLGSKNDSVERIRHHSSSNDIAGIHPVEFREKEEISYGHLLSMFTSSRHQRHALVSPAKVAKITQRRIGSTDQEIDQLGDKIQNHYHRTTSRASSCDPQDIVRDISLEEDVIESTLSKTFPSSDSLLYDPNLLDNPDFESGNHKTMLRFPGYMTSIMDYVDRYEMKKELNERFRQRFPHISLTYSKFKSIKREMAYIAKECDVDAMPLAHAIVFFEKVVLKGLITKANRKLVSGAALLIAVKLNDIRSVQLSNVIDKIETVFRLSRKELMQFEIPLCVALDFNLKLPDWEIFPHYQKLMLAKL